MAKGILIGLGAIGLVVGGALILSKPTQAASPEGPSADVTIAVYDSNGNLVPHHSPYSLNEGSTYTVKATVKNTSTKGGVASPATMTFTMVGTSTKKTYMSLLTFNYSFAANETKEFDGTLTSVIGDAPDTGAIAASLTDPSSNVVASGNQTFNIVALPVVYGGTITFI